MGKFRYAQPLYGKIIYIYETDLPFEELSTVFDPKTYWIDVTGQDCEVGYIAKYEEGGGIVFAAPESIVEPTETEKEAARVKATLETKAKTAMMMSLAGSDLSEAKTEYQAVLASVSDEVALLMPEVYPVWSGSGVEYKKDMRVTYNTVLYKVLQDHTSQETWTPTDAPSLFVKVLISESEILDWEQPSADNAYMKGDKVKYNGKVYESLIDNNVWKPDEYPAGWKEVTETITIL